MECVKTQEYHSFTCWPCVLAAAGSSRFRRFNLSLRKAAVSGSWRTGEATTANSPRGSPLQDLWWARLVGGEGCGQRAGAATSPRGREGRPPPTAPPAEPPHRPLCSRDSTLMQALCPCRFSDARYSMTSLILGPLATARRAAQPFLWGFPKLVRRSFKSI